MQRDSDSEMSVEGGKIDEEGDFVFEKENSDYDPKPKKSEKPRKVRERKVKKPKSKQATRNKLVPKVKINGPEAPQGLYNDDVASENSDFNSQVNEGEDLDFTETAKKESNLKKFDSFRTDNSKDTGVVKSIWANAS